MSMSLTSLGAVAAGGAMGATLRYMVSVIIGVTGFPIATLLVNVIGSLMMGVIAALAMQWEGFHHGWRLFLMVGVLGGFTTFSSFALDSVSLWQRGEVIATIGYIGASVMLSIAAFAAGIVLMRLVAGVS